MKGKQLRILALIDSIIGFLEANRGATVGVEEVLGVLGSMDLSIERTADVAAQSCRHDEVLSAAIGGIVAPELSEIATCLSAAKDDLVWREDNAEYYPAGADLGDGYKRCNLHSLLIGPDACGFEEPNFSLGVFMLGPRTLYRDHNHDAPELYLNLSERSGWRFELGEWNDLPAGSLVWNPSGQPHATRVYDEPFISVFVWTKDIDALCNVIPVDDWADIEDALASGAETSR